MKFKTDENMPDEAAEVLKQAGYDARTVPDQHLSGQPDSQIADICRTEARALVTLDLDFSDIRAYPPKFYGGIIVLRPSLQTVKNVQRLVGQVIALLNSESLPGKLWIVDEGQIRIRDG